MKPLPLLVAALAALATFNVHADGSGAAASACSAGDSTCIGGNRGNRPTTGTQTLGSAAAMARVGCTQGTADSTCAVPNGAPMAGYIDLNADPTPKACRGLAPSIWSGSCPSPKIGSITYRSDYACAYQTVYQTGSLVPIKVYAEPGQYGPAYVAAYDCVDPPPPPPPAPAFSYIYSVSSHWGFCGGSSFGGQTQPILSAISFTTAGANARDLIGYCEYSFSTPWGVSPQNSFQSMPRAQALIAPMQYLKDRGCSIASEDPAALDAAIAGERARSLAFGYPPSTVEAAMNMIRANIGIDDWYYSNYAACPTQVR